jgi:hypothetical protein
MHLKILKNLRGTWQVKLQSNQKDPVTNLYVNPTITYLVLRQKLLTLNARMFTSDSTSDFIATRIKKAKDGTYNYIAVYRNESNISVRDNSPMHYGALLLSIQLGLATNLDGHYWTDAGSQGELRSVAHNTSYAGSFNHAQSLSWTMKA